MIFNLRKGFEKFKDEFYRSEEDCFRDLVKNGQKPLAMVIACSDSRVDPALLLGARPGDLFVVRNIANLVPPYDVDDNNVGVSAALEYAVKELEVKEIIVMGHSFCGGINALCSKYLGKSDHQMKFVDKWVKIAEPILDLIDPQTDLAEINRNLEKKSVLHSLKNLRSFPWIRSREVENKIMLKGLWFDMEKGILLVNDNKGLGFRVLSARKNLSLSKD